MRTFRTPYSVEPSPGERKTTLPSMTTPDMSLSVAQILLRFAQGRSLSTNPHLMYGGNDFYPDVRKLDLTEQQEAYEYARERVKALTDQYNNVMKLRAEERRKKLEELYNPKKPDEAVIVT